jgi:hypothetical protein
MAAQLDEIRGQLDQGMTPDAIADYLGRVADLGLMDIETVRPAAYAIAPRQRRWMDLSITRDPRDRATNGWFGDCRVCTSSTAYRPITPTSMLGNRTDYDATLRWTPNGLGAWRGIRLV